MAMVTVQRQRQDEGCADRRKVGRDVADCGLATAEEKASSCCARRRRCCANQKVDNCVADGFGNNGSDGSSCCARALAMVVQIGKR